MWFAYCEILALVFTFVFNFSWWQTQIGAVFFSVFITAMTAGSGTKDEN
jgi:hypothetical protein